MTTLAYCPQRLRRAAWLVVKRRVEAVGGGRYRVLGASGTVYHVDAHEPSCECEDWARRQMWKDQPCKHILAGLLMERYEPVVQAWGDILLNEQQHMEQHTRRTRRLSSIQSSAVSGGTRSPRSPARSTVPLPD